MANEINAVAGQLWGIPMGEVYTAGPGIKIDNVHKVVSVDETVLWSAPTSAGLELSVGGEITLSETADGKFERLRIYACRNGHPIGVDVSLDFSVQNSGVINVPSYIYTSSADTLYIDITSFTLSGAKLTVSTSRRKSLGANAISSTNVNMFLCQVVGINRKSA